MTTRFCSAMPTSTSCFGSACCSENEPSFHRAARIARDGDRCSDSPSPVPSASRRIHGVEIGAAEFSGQRELFPPSRFRGGRIHGKCGRAHGLTKDNEENEATREPKLDLSLIPLFTLFPSVNFSSFLQFAQRLFQFRIARNTMMPFGDIFHEAHAATFHGVRDDARWLAGFQRACSRHQSIRRSRGR